MCALCHAHYHIDLSYWRMCASGMGSICLQSRTNTLQQHFLSSPERRATQRERPEEPISVMYPLWVLHIRKQACAQRMPVQEKEPRLPTLLKLLLWAQSQLDSKLQYPRMVDLVAGRLSDPTDVNQMC